eukprot:357270-Chlamydomonas_euryale.AAC.17
MASKLGQKLQQPARQLGLLEQHKLPGGLLQFLELHATTVSRVTTVCSAPDTGRRGACHAHEFGCATPLVLYYKSTFVFGGAAAPAGAYGCCLPSASPRHAIKRGCDLSVSAPTHAHMLHVHSPWSRLFRCLPLSPGPGGGAAVWPCNAPESRD